MPTTRACRVCQGSPRSITMLLPRQGCAVQSVNWGAWAGHGMAAKAGLERMARLGYGAVQPEAGMAALGCLLGHAGSPACGPQLLGSCFHWDRCPAQPESGVKGPGFAH